MANKHKELTPAMMRKPNTGGIRNEMQEQRKRDLAALENAKEMERRLVAGCITVRVGISKLTAKPETIYHILNERGYKYAEIEEIMQTAK